MKREILEEIRVFRRNKIPVVLITNLDDGTQQIYREQDRILDLDPVLVEKTRQALRRDQSAEVDHAATRYFLQVFSPPLRLMLIGAVHIAQSLSELAAIAGFDVSIIDPREAFTDSERFPGIAISGAWPDQALNDAAIDHRCAVVTLAHDPKLDDAALSVALRSNAFYVGSLGSKRTHATRLRRLREAGFDDGELARIRGPVGLSIGAISAAEISVSILAEIIAALRKSEC
jgi:xanthine dehydrogenase accessory factor